MAITVRPLSAALGAEIGGVDLSKPLDEATFAAIHKAWLDGVIILFRGQKLVEDDQERFCRRFGELEIVRSAVSQDNGHPAVLLITNVRNTGKVTALEDGEMMFHYDQCYYEHPCMGSTLYAMEVPKDGGNTIFANCALAYDGLPEAMKRRIAGLKARNYYDYKRDPTIRPKDLNPDAPQWVHPIVRTHSETGRKAIYVNRLMTIRVEGVDPDESDGILNALFDHIEKPEFHYEHRWQIGDMIMWDNRCSVHARTHFAPDVRRMMRRVTVRDPMPVA